MGAVFFTALLIMLIGLIGCAVPAMPGLPIIWLGALFFAWQTDFQIIGWPMLALLFILMAAGATSGIWRDWRRMMRAGRGYMVSWAVSLVVEGGIGVLMIALFVTRVALYSSLNG